MEKKATRGRPVAPISTHLLDNLIDRLALKNDAALSRLLHIAPPVISRMRHGTVGVSDSNLVRIHDITGMSIAEVRDLAGLPQPTYDQ